MPSKIVIERFGPPSSLVIRPAEPRSPGPGEVRIDVAYSGVNFADVAMRIGLYPDAPKRPFVPGYEVSGTVAEVGADVTSVVAGDQVMAGTYFGGYSSTLTVPAHQVFPIPDMELAAGAALPVAFFTARLALAEMARVRAGDRVLIECATGGVGVVAAQLAQHAGAHVTGLTTSPAKKPFLADRGVTPYTVEEFRADQDLRGYDVIVNASGGRNITWQRRRLGLTGRMVCLGGSSGVKDGKRSLLRVAALVAGTPRISVLRLFGDNTGIYALNALHVMRDTEWVTRLTQSMATIGAMNLQPHIGKVFAADDVASAHTCLATKQATGKLLLAWR
jgi:2-desacetyl-2-hydroxyethyl bacteriochlorophyllide A dehydrogenase